MAPGQFAERGEKSKNKIPHPKYTQVRMASAANGYTAEPARITGSGVWVTSSASSVRFCRASSMLASNAVSDTLK